jgi:hypothetical protein
MNRKMIGEAIYIRVSDSKIKSDSHEMWKCADPVLERVGAANPLFSLWRAL